MDEVTIICPYCEHPIQRVPLPADKAGSEPEEVVGVPYTRDVGRFDPESEDDWFDVGGWSRIGKDYLKAIAWERIGILRVTRPGIDIRYRVQGCPECKCLFDVFANYTPGQKVAQLWPHIFTPNPRHPDEFVPNRGESWLIWLVRHLGKLLRSSYLGAITIGIFHLLLGAASVLVARQIQLTGPLSSSPFKVLFAYSLDAYFIKQLVVYLVAAFSSVIVLILFNRYIQYLQTSTDFENLFKVAQPKRGVQYWRNYTLSRFVGYQHPNARFPRATQTDIAAGSIALVTLLYTWLVNNRHGFNVVLFMLGIGLFAGLAIFYPRWVHKGAAKRGLVYLPLVLIEGLLLAALLWGLRGFLALPVYARLGFASLALDLGFWVIFATLIGTAAHMALSSITYVLQGVTRIPVRLKPFNFKPEEKALRVMQTYSTTVLLIVFLTVLTLVAILQLNVNQPNSIQLGDLHAMLPQAAEWLVTSEWIRDWLRWGLTLILTAAGIGLGRGEYLGVAIFYTGLSFLLAEVEMTPAPIYGGFAISLNGSLIALGVFFTILIGFQITRTESYINKILTSARQKAQNSLEEQLEAIYQQLMGVEAEIKNKLAQPALALDSMSPLYSQRNDILQSIETLQTLEKNLLAEASKRRLPFLKILQFFTPILVSVLIESAVIKVYQLVIQPAFNDVILPAFMR